MATLKTNHILYCFTLFMCYFVLTASNCRRNNKQCQDGSHNTIYFKNNSNVSVNWRRSETPNDTVWVLNGSTYPNVDDGLILSGATSTRTPGLATCWEYYFSGSYFEYHYFYSHDTVLAIGWKQINSTNRGLLKKVKVDLDYLKNYNFTITYP